MFEWFISHGQGVTFASNITWGSLALVVSVVMLTSLSKFKGTKPDYWWTMLGVFLVALPSAVQRFYWAVWTWYLDNGNIDTAAAWANYKGILAPLIISIALGYLCHIRSLFGDKAKKHWWLLCAGIISSIWITSYTAVSML